MRSIQILVRVRSMKAKSWNDQSISRNFLVGVVYKIVSFWFYIVTRIAWKWKKAEKKRVSGCNSVAVKTMKIRINLLYCKLKAFTPTPHISYIWEWIIVAHITAVSQNGIRHVHFFFYFKIFVQSTFIYIINLLKPYLFQSSKWHWGFSWA